MGKTVAKVFGISAKKPDTSAYERQIAEQKAATEAKEAEAAQLKAEQDAAAQRRLEGRASLIATGAAGDETTTSVKRKSLLGA